MCSLHLTHPSAHTPGAVDTHTHLEQWAVRGAVGVLVPCSRVSPQSWTNPAGAEIRTHNLELQVTLYPLEPRLPLLKLAFCSEVHILSI